MQTIKNFQRTAPRRNVDVAQNPENKRLLGISNSEKDTQTDQKTIQGMSCYNNLPQNQSLLNYIWQIYQKTLSNDATQLLSLDEATLSQDEISEMVKKINQEIERLQQREEQLIEFFRKLQNTNKKSANEQKWKLVVLTYKEKISKLQTKLRQERESKLKLQELIELQIEERQRLNQLNTIKYRKINNLMADIQYKQAQFSELNQTITQLQSSLSHIKQSNSVLQNKVQQLDRENMELSHQLDNQRQRSFMLAQEREQIVTKFKVLGDQEEEINKQIRDLKTKYEIQIAKLENKVAILQIQNQEALLLLEQFQMNDLKRNSQKLYFDSETQTENQVVKACYFNSLADQLSDYNQESVEFQSENNPTINESKICEHNQENLQQQFNFHLQLGTNSYHNKDTFTGRQADKQNYAKETLSERGLFAARFQSSFDDGNSISNTPSKYLETMGELTNQLAEAYQKINDLTARVGELEGQKIKVEKKLRERQNPNEAKIHQREKKGFGYFSSFFKK